MLRRRHCRGRSLNFKSQRAGRVAIDGWTRPPLPLPISFRLLVLPRRREKTLSNFSPLLSPPPPFSFSRIGLFLLFADTVRLSPSCCFHRDYAKQLLWNAVSCSQTHADVTRVLSHPGTCPMLPRLSRKEYIQKYN